MSDHGAFAGAQMIAEYLSIRDFMNGLDRNRVNAQLTADNALLRRDAEQIVARYNQLVAEYNELLRRATEVAKEADRKDSVIAELQHQAEELRSAKAVLEVESERLRRENTGQAIRIQWLSDIVRQDRPGYLPDC
jgi:peptidoglycan hydrolase CwlO-like protein